MPVLNYQVNAPGYGGINPKLVYIFTNDPIAKVTETSYIDWLANPNGIYPGDVALIVTQETPTSNLGVGFYEFVRIGTTNHWNLVPITNSPMNVDSVTGVLNQIIASPTTGNVVVSIYPNPQLPGSQSVGLPHGTTAQRMGIVGSIRFNTDTGLFEGTADGTTWIAFASGSSAVTSVSGTANETAVSPTTGNVVVALASNPHIPGTGSVGLPSGTTAQQAGIAGSIRFNSQTSVFESTVDGVVWAVIETSATGVISIIGTASQIHVSNPTGNVTLSLSDNAVFPGTGAVTLPSGNSAARAGAAGSIRFNSQTGFVELTNDGTNWYSIIASNTGVILTLTGTTDRITVTSGQNPVVDIAATYVGQSSITTVGTITSGVWDATPVAVPFGGTGNTSFTAYNLITANTTSTGALEPLGSLGTSGQVLTSNGAGAYPTWQIAPGSGGSQQATIAIAAADFIASRTTSVLILAAPGANKMIVPIAVQFELAYGGTPFAGGAGTSTTLYINYVTGTTGGSASNNVLGAGGSTGGDATMFNGKTSNWLVETPITLNNSASLTDMQQSLRLTYSGLTLTGGTSSTIYVHLEYIIVTTTN